MKHSYSAKACPACGDIDGCHSPLRETLEKESMTPEPKEPSKTPRTDNVEVSIWGIDYVKSDFARHLETELSTANAEVERLKAIQICTHEEVYYSAEGDNYYCKQCHHGMGNHYYNLAKQRDALLAEVERLRNIFKHYHVNNGVDDACKQCGLDLRNEIHTRL